ncbi:response regulator transcription factor [Desulforamulus aeronauticus]|uniref:Stage 0 sporulation protein A homolog n=1 Tax=Desulforamulus aeronauticus DSM 10349 TaxID=1121421 RepID=A0A1M6Q1K3_9FIRM|nr:response regulator transcription factor [Desulforamulus aeronauticus]SHK14090.1 DNA-binding response regulator, OmpR family, contains REC and winged-helix (wHTH) domain [Desulforamulus aeronauticus DSM 10349]
MNNILVVEDEDILREVIMDYLMEDGYRVLEAADGEKALELFQSNSVDLVILDIVLPKLDGWSVCCRIRKNSTIPIIILTARSDEDDSLLGYELGADDYLIKPYSPRILMAKVRRFLEKYSGTMDGMLLSAGGISINMRSRLVSVDGNIISLTHTEFEILAYLMQNEGIVITREQLIAKIWGYDFYGDEKTVNSHMRNLRAKLGSKGSCIVTVIRSGYKFEKELL